MSNEMTKEEAIKHIKAMCQMLLGADNKPISDTYYALEMALEKLSAEPCEDAISRQAAIEEIRFGQSFITKIYPTGEIEHLFDKENKALEAAVERIEALPSVTPKQGSMTKWIPVSERLPEENGYYLTTTMYHEVYCDYWEEERFNRTEAVIAWMPLPEPYKAESEEQDG